MTDKDHAAPATQDAACAPRAAPALVLDTNVLLDLWLFEDPRLTALRSALSEGRARWLASETMLRELAFVRERAFARCYQPLPELGQPSCELLAEPEAPAPWRCRDSGDQKFLDLAWQCRVPLWSRDRDLLSLTKRSAKLGLIIETPEQGLRRLFPA